MTIQEYEDHAAEFYRETGMMAPGKDVPGALAGSWDREAAERKWAEFLSRPVLDCPVCSRTSTDKQ